jgi:hypothetical protein
MKSTINHDEVCFVQEIDESHCFVCMAKKQDMDTCPHAKDVGFADIFCTHQDRAIFPKK